MEKNDFVIFIMGVLAFILLVLGLAYLEAQKEMENMESVTSCEKEFGKNTPCDKMVL